MAPSRIGGGIRRPDRATASFRVYPARSRRQSAAAGLDPALTGPRGCYPGRMARVRILATGGTIAGQAPSQTDATYRPGQVAVETSSARCATWAKLATVSGEQVAQIGSQDMNDARWLELAARADALFAAGRGGRDRDHPRHRLHGGDRLLPAPRGEERPAGGADGRHAPRDLALARRPLEPLQRGGGGGRPRGPRPRRDRGLERRPAQRAGRHQVAHLRRAGLRLSRPRASWAPRPTAASATSAGPRGGTPRARSSRRGPSGPAAGGRPLRARRHVARPRGGQRRARRPRPGHGGHGQRQRDPRGGGGPRGGGPAAGWPWCAAPGS